MASTVGRRPKDSGSTLKLLSLWIFQSRSVPRSFEKKNKSGHSPVPPGPRDGSPLTWTRARSSGRTPLPAEIGDLPCAQGLVEITSLDVHTFAQAEVTNHQCQVDADGRTTDAGVVDVAAHDGKVISATPVWARAVFHWQRPFPEPNLQNPCPECRDVWTRHCTRTCSC